MIGTPNVERYAVPSASAYGSPSRSGRCPATAPLRNAVALSACHEGRSSLSTTAIFWGDVEASVTSAV
jgi:hypothetical protein